MNTRTRARAARIANTMIKNTGEFGFFGTADLAGSGGESGCCSAGATGAANKRVYSPGDCGAIGTTGSSSGFTPAIVGLGLAAGIEPEFPNIRVNSPALFVST